MTNIERMLTDIRFYEQVLGDARRTILCPPDLVEAVRAVVEAHDVGGLYRVAALPLCPDGRLIAIDEQALDAAMRQTVQSFARGVRVR